MKRWQKALQDNYGTPTLELISGKGSSVKASDGKTYLDFLAGIATNVLGHAHPAIVKAVKLLAMSVTSMPTPMCLSLRKLFRR